MTALREPIGARYQDEDGWNGPGSRSTTIEARETLSHLVAVPQVDGGISLELYAGGMDVDICIQPDGRITLVMAGVPDPVSAPSDPLSRPGATPDPAPPHTGPDAPQEPT